MSLKATLLTLQEQIESEIERWQKFIAKKVDVQHANSSTSRGTKRIEQNEFQRGEEYGLNMEVEEVWVDDRTRPHEETRNMFLLSQLRARLKEGSTLLRSVGVLRQTLLVLHKEGGDPLLTSMASERQETWEVAPLQKQLEITKERSARQHINLGKRLHKEAMDEKLESELLEVKEGRRQVEHELQTRVQQVKRVEAEVDKLQRLLDVEDGEQVRRLMAEVALHKQCVGRMEEEVMGAAQQQQERTLEEQVQAVAEVEVDEEAATRVSEAMGRVRAVQAKQLAGLGGMAGELERLGSLVVSVRQQSSIRRRRRGWRGFLFFFRRPPRTATNTRRGCCACLLPPAQHNQLRASTIS